MTSGPWLLFTERLVGGRTVRVVAARGLTRERAERVARAANAARRTRFGRRLVYAAPEASS